MANKTDKKFDSIFEPTSDEKKADKSAETKPKKAPAKRVSKKDDSARSKDIPAPKAAAKTVEPGTGTGADRKHAHTTDEAVAKRQAAAASKAAVAEAKSGEFEPVDINRMQVLGDILQTHYQEALYRKGKEDRLLTLGLALITAVALSAFLIRAFLTVDPGGWLYSLVFRTAFAVVIALTGFAVASMVELNRTRLQDVFAMIVKVHESLRLFDDNVYNKGGGSYLPNTYKFVGSFNDDESNYAIITLKLGSVIGALAVFILV
ncbi:MAG: hypothetical protein H6683_03655 [Deltaproteobacteria bacterium]|nr:hypothetical protein [Deltaproteobacteria bacterium]MCB9478751.1 hypothetical protein [Deltaproteobacteria bacterium]